MKSCNCRGWSGSEYHCRDGISWNADDTEYQAYPPGESCRCGDEECCDYGDGPCRCATQVSPVGTWLVVDGVVRRVRVTFHAEEDELTPECWEVDAEEGS